MSAGFCDIGHDPTSADDARACGSSQRRYSPISLPSDDALSLLLPSTTESVKPPPVIPCDTVASILGSEDGEVVSGNGGKKRKGAENAGGKGKVGRPTNEYLKRVREEEKAKIEQMKMNAKSSLKVKLAKSLPVMSRDRPEILAFVRFLEHKHLELKNYLPMHHPFESNFLPGSFIADHACFCQLRFFCEHSRFYLISKAKHMLSYMVFIFPFSAKNCSRIRKDAREFLLKCSVDQNKIKFKTHMLDKDSNVNISLIYSLYIFHRVLKGQSALNEFLDIKDDDADETFYIQTIIDLMNQMIF